VSNAYEQFHGIGRLVSGLLANGAPVSIHYRGGMARDGDGLLWEINGTKGDIRVSGPFGHAQFVPLLLKGAQGDEKAFQTLEVPAPYRTGFPEEMIPGNIARNYAKMAKDLQKGTHTAPSFDDAVALHRVIAAVEEAAETGRRTKLTW
jgi:predicted dehydrogenase